MRFAGVLVVTLVAGIAGGGCGRLGLDDQPPTPAPVDAPAPPPTLVPLVCGQPTATTGTVGAMADQIALVVSDGQAVALSSDSSNVAQSWAYAISASGTFVQQAVGVSLATDCTGTLAIASGGAGNALASWSNTLGSTDLQQLAAATGTPSGMSTGSVDAPASRALAASGVDGTLALITIGSNGEVDAVKVDATGAATGTAIAVIDASIGAGDVEIATAAPGYALTWTDPNPSPNTKQVELLGPDFSVVAGPVTANTGASDAENGQIAWAPASNLYLSAWQDKDMANNDEINIRVFDGQLVAIGAASMVIAANTSDPRIAGDGSGFWLTARGYNPDTLVVDRVAADGTVDVLSPIPASALAWTIGARAGQPIVTWLVQNSLWLDVPCAP